MTMRMRLGRNETSKLCILVLVCLLDLSMSLPAEQPTRFTLSTGGTSIGSQATFSFDQGRELLGRIADAIRIGTGRFVNSVTLARNIVADRWETLTSVESRNKATAVIAAKPMASNREEISLGTTQYPPVTNTLPNSRENVRLENETGQSFFERPISKPIAGVLESLLKPTPLVDGIREQEKYGNSGDKFIGIGRALVSSFEGFSNFLNAIVDFPRNAAKKTTRGITEALNHVGARLVGLE